MSEAIEVFRGAVFPWYCNHMGHMNIMYYVHMFDQGQMHVMSSAGYRWKEDGEGFTNVSQNIEYLSELHAGDLVVVKGTVQSVGKTSCKVLLEMYHAESGTLAATSTSVLVVFSLRTRQAIPIPPELREGLTNLMVNADG